MTNPTNPVLITTYDPSDEIYDMTALGSAVFLASLDGMETLDCSNPAVPSYVASWNDGDLNAGQDIAIYNSLLYLADAMNGLKILDSGYDFDEDGLSNWAEIHDHYTNMADNDTDDDGLLDGEEVTRPVDPLDPLDPDCDDGLLDGAEVLRGTDPFDADTDNDGYSDKREVDAGTNPLDPASYPRSSTPGGVDGYITWLLLPAIAAMVLVLAARKRVAHA
ncbi:MAG: hypothetical protein Q6373_021890 [Candidatus Sigynarchaeota archaeon]